MSGELFSFPGVAEDIGYLGYRDLDDLEALRVGGRSTLEPLFVQTGYPANSDYFPILDQRAPKARFKRESADEIRTLRENEVPLVAMLDGEARTPLERLASVDNNRPMRLERALSAAEAVGVFVTGSASRAVSLSEPLQLKASVAGSLLQGCATSTQLWVGAVRDLVRVSAPYLNAQDTAVVFEKIRASPCWKGLDEASRLRIALFEAVSRRDADAMSQRANALLALTDANLVPERGYYVMAAMTGHLARGPTPGGRCRLATPRRGASRRDARLAHHPAGARPRARGAVRAQVTIPGTFCRASAPASPLPVGIGRLHCGRNVPERHERQGEAWWRSYNWLI